MLRNAGYGSHIGEAGRAGSPLSVEQQADYRVRCTIHSRVGHLFGSQEDTIPGTLVRTTGPLL